MSTGGLAERFRFAKRISAMLGVFIAVLASGTGPAVADQPACKLDSAVSTLDANINPGTAVLQLDYVFLDYAGGSWQGLTLGLERMISSGDASPQMSFTAAVNLASAYQHEGQYAAAISAMNGAIETHADDSIGYADRGALYFDTGNLDAAIADATKALAIDPCRKSAYQVRAMAYQKQHLSSNAARDNASIIRIDSDQIVSNPKDKDAYLRRGADEYFQGENTLAIADFNKVILLDPKNAAAFVDRGLAYEAQGRMVDDINDQIQAVTLSPKDETAWNNLCWAMAISGDYADALSSCSQAVKLAPWDEFAWDSSGFVDLKMKNDARAISNYEAALRLDPYQASSYYGIGLAERDRGDGSDAGQFIAKAEAIDPDIAEIFSR